MRSSDIALQEAGVPKDDVTPMNEVAVVPVVLADLDRSFEHSGARYAGAGNVPGPEGLPTSFLEVLVLVGAFPRLEDMPDGHEHLTGSVEFPRVSSDGGLARAPVARKGLLGLEKNIGLLV